MASTFDKWPFHPEYLTQVLDLKVLRLLLTGIAAELKSPAGLWETRGGSNEVVFPLGVELHYPDFCQILSVNTIQRREGISEKGLQILGEIHKECGKDQLKRAESFLGSPGDALDSRISSACTECHLGLHVIYAPVILAGRTVAFGVSGGFGCSESDRGSILEKIHAYGFDTSDLRSMKALIEEIPIMTLDERKRFEDKFREEVKTLVEVAKRFSYWKTEHKQWRITGNIGSTINTVFTNPGENLQDKTLHVLEVARDFWDAPFVALFCSERPGDTVLPLFCQQGIKADRVRHVHFNWQKAGISTKKDFDSFPWLRDRIEEADYPARFLERGLKGEGSDLMQKASFLLAYASGNQYRGVFLIGDLGREGPKEHKHFLSVTGHLIATRILALVAIERLNEGEEWRDVMTKHWAHDMRSDVHALMGESALLEAQCDSLLSSSGPNDRLRLALQRINTTLNEMREKALRYIHAPEAALLIKMDQSYLNREYHSLSAIVLNCVERIENMARRMNLSTEVDQSLYDLPGAEIDSRLMPTVFRLILDNALKYSYDGTVIRISGSVPDQASQWVDIRIQNQGAGIPYGERKKIFAPGYRSRVARNMADGAGLGLYQARHIVQIHGGRIWADSQLVGTRSGKDEYLTTFVVSLESIFRSVRG